MSKLPGYYIMIVTFNACLRKIIVIARIVSDLYKPILEVMYTDIKLVIDLYLTYEHCLTEF